MEHNATKFLRLIILAVSLVSIGLAGSGCGDVQKLDLSPKSVFLNPAPEAVPPDFGDVSHIVLQYDGLSVHVGDSAQKAFELFPKPKKAYEFRDLPVQFGKEFKGRGWESELEGFGLISYEDKVVVAMRTISKVERRRVDEAVREARSEAGAENQIVSGTRAEYWFWEEGKHRKMICATKTSDDEYLLTVAIGELNAMNSLRMSLLSAERDKQRSDAAPSKPQS